MPRRSASPLARRPPSGIFPSGVILSIKLGNSSASFALAASTENPDFSANCLITSFPRTSWTCSGDSGVVSRAHPGRDNLSQTFLLKGLHESVHTARLLVRQQAQYSFLQPALLTLTFERGPIALPTRSLKMPILFPPVQILLVKGALGGLFHHLFNAC